MNKKIFDLSQFDIYRENNRLEVKKATGGLPHSLWDTYSAMANTHGGVIICGVEEREDGSWYTSGMKNVAKLKKNLWDQINDRKKVNINLLRDQDVAEYDIDGDVIMVIYVPKARREERPVYINDNLFGGTFRRNHEGDYHCTVAEVKAMLRDQTAMSGDMKVLPDMEIADFDQDTIRTYRLRHQNRTPDHVWHRLADEQYLEMIGAAKMADDKTLHPTAAGLLMFGKEYKILYEYPFYFLDYREKMEPTIRWTDRIQSQSGDWSGNVFDFFTRVSVKLTIDLKRPFRLDGIYRVDEGPVHEAVREALANCLVNADFFQEWSVVIERYPDRIVMANPGLIRTGKEQMLHGGISDPRNSAMMKMFNLIGIGERAGSGVPDIYAVWRAVNYEEPIVAEFFGADKPDRTILTLPLVPSAKDDNHLAYVEQAATPDEVPTDLEKILAFCKTPHSKREMMEYINMKSRSSFERNILKPLLASGKIQMTNPDSPNSSKQKYYVP